MQDPEETNGSAEAVGLVVVPAASPALVVGKKSRSRPKKDSASSQVDAVPAEEVSMLKPLKKRPLVTPEGLDGLSPISESSPQPVTETATGEVGCEVLGEVVTLQLLG